MDLSEIIAAQVKGIYPTDIKIPSDKSAPIFVDASTRNNPGPTEYRGMQYGKIIFERKLQYASINIGEFLAVVDALRYCQLATRPPIAIYSDSVTALAWVKYGRINTGVVLGEEVLNEVNLAVSFILLNRGSFRVPLVLWDTKKYGDIPADYRRKPGSKQGISRDNPVFGKKPSFTTKCLDYIKSKGLDDDFQDFLKKYKSNGKQI